ncbi:MAG: M48 family metallopeptidase [Methanothermobacter sp.]|nr:M48 family metallopeptidase [Methanothermobacter sp.]
MERYVRLKYTGSYIKVNEGNFPDIYNMLVEVCDILHLKPEFYMQWDYTVNGFTTEIRLIIVFTSGAVDLLTNDELLYVIGHEVGYIKSGHMLYHEMAEVIPIIGEIVGYTMGITNIVGWSLQFALLYWQRMSEFTADRAGLLAC